MMKRIRRAAKESLLEAQPGLFWRYVEWRHGNLEPEMELLPELCRRDQASVDVGASYGSYSFLMMKYSKKCFAFEPQPRCAEILRKGYRGRLTVHEVALSDHAGTADLRVPTNQHGYSTIETSNRLEGKLREPCDIERVRVRVQSLDEFDLGAVGFIKLDVEGHEEEVLAGAERTLRSHHPALLIEVEERHRAGSVARVLGMLQGHDYRGFFYRAGCLHPAEEFDLPRHQDPARPEQYVRNFIFLPEHRLPDFHGRLR